MENPCVHFVWIQMEGSGDIILLTLPSKWNEMLGQLLLLVVKERPPTPPIWASTNFSHVQHTVLIVLLDPLTNMKIWTGLR
jgi:hypothetical protein